jgi:hypothetical protein
VPPSTTLSGQTPSNNTNAAIESVRAENSGPKP